MTFSLIFLSFAAAALISAGLALMNPLICVVSAVVLWVFVCCLRDNCMMRRLRAEHGMPQPGRITMIRMAPGSRMLRAGLGQHEGRWFARVDLWWVGFRLAGSR